MKNYGIKGKTVTHPFGPGGDVIAVLQLLRLSFEKLVGFSATAQLAFL